MKKQLIKHKILLTISSIGALIGYVGITVVDSVPCGVLFFISLYFVAKHLLHSNYLKDWDNKIKKANPTALDKNEIYLNLRLDLIEAVQNKKMDRQQIIKFLSLLENKIDVADYPKKYWKFENEVHKIYVYLKNKSLTDNDYTELHSQLRSILSSSTKPTVKTVKTTYDNVIEVSFASAKS